MENSFESSRRDMYETEIIPDRFGFKSAGKKYINQKYKRIGAILGVEGEWLGNIKRQAKEENQLPDIQEQEELSLEQINFYRAHYDFSPLTQDEYETVKAQNASSEAIIDEQVEEVTEVEKTDINISSEEGVELIKKLTRKDFGSMPEDPYDIKNDDLEALNNLFNAKPDQFPNSRYVNIRNWADWTPITVVRPENITDPNLQWSITKGNNNELIGKFLSEEDAEAEFNRIKNEDKQKALDLLRKARNFAIGEDLESPWTDSVDVSIETPSPAEASIPSDIESGRPAEGEGVQVEEGEVVSGETTPGESPEEAKGEEVSEEELPEVEALQAALDSLIDESVEKENNKVTEEGGKLSRVEDGKYTGEPDIETNLNALELDILRESSQEAINKYQEFHNSFRKEYRTPAIQEQYRKLEKEAWDRVEELAHKLGGRIIELPRGLEFNKEYDEDIDIKTRDKLNSDLGYKFNQEGQITHIEINGNTIQLNRPRTVDELLNGDRPARILYHSGKQILNEDPFKKHYKGYWIKGLNLNTIQDMERELSGNQFPQPDIIDETITTSDIIDDPNLIQYYRNLEPIDLPETNTNQELNGPPVMQILQVEQGTPNFNSTEKYSLEDKSDQDPWNTESRGDTEFKKIFAGNLSKNRDVQGNNEIPDPWVKKATAVNPEAPEQAEVVEDLPIDNPDRGSLYYQEIQLWSNIQALENRQKENPKDESVKVELDKAKQAYQEFRSAISTNPEQDKFKQFLELRELYAQAESENTRGRIQKLFRLKKNNSSELENIRSQYNEALEALLKTETIIGVEGKIKEMFSDEVQRLSGERVVQTKELQEKNQSGLDRALNPLKDRIFNWYIKNKSAVGAVNLGLFATSTLLAFTGAGIPLAGAVNTLRHTIAYPMAVASGISSRELIRSKFEDENTNLNLDIKKFNLKTNFEFLKFKGGITKLVDKSLQENYIQNASDEDLSKLVSTLESYYGLNGGKFTELSQQKAYEMGLNELGARLERANNQSTDEQEISNESNVVDGLDYKFDFKNTKEFKIKTVDGLVTRISQDRISALNDQKNKRLVANVAGTALGSSLLFNLVAQDLQFNKPNLGDSASTTGEMRPKIPTTDTTLDTQGTGSGPGSSGEASAPEAGAGVTKPIPDASPAGTGADTGEALRQTQESAAAAEQAQELAQDVSSLDSGETIWGEIAKQLGENATDTQIQQAVENYLQSQAGQESIFELAQQTEGGRELLSQWGIDNAGEMAGLSKEQLYEVSKYLGEGKLDGLTELSLDNLDALKQAEYVAPSPTEAPTIEPGSTETPAPPAGTEDIGSKPPAPSSPPVTEAPIAPPSPVEAPVTPSEFTKDLSEILGKQNLTDIQAKEIVQSYFADDYGRKAIYNSIINTGEGATVLSNGFGVNTLADFANITPDQMYEITNSIDSNELRKILNQTILARFEDAPDMVELTRGTNSLNVVQRYIANELGSLPYDSNLGKQVLDTYVQTDAGKMWIYDAIVNNPDVNNQNIQYFKEYLRFKDIKSPEEFVSKFNWAEFSGNRNIPTSGFWNQIRLPNGGTRLQPLSSFLKPGQMPGIKDAVRQVLTRQ